MAYHDPLDLADYCTWVDDPRHFPDPEVFADLIGELYTFAGAAARAEIDDDFIRSIQQSIRDGFRRLHALPRDNPFWDGTNGLATFQLLRPFCTELVRDDPLDDGALWTLAALEVVSFANFDASLWLPFAELGGLNPSWPIYAAFFVDSYCGTDSVPELSFLLDRVRLREAARPTLARLAQSRQNAIRVWAVRARAHCQTRFPREASPAEVGAATDSGIGLATSR